MIKIRLDVWVCLDSRHSDDCQASLVAGCDITSRDWSDYYGDFGEYDGDYGCECGRFYV